MFPAKPAVSQLISYTVATIWSYCWNRRFTFSSDGRTGPALEVALETAFVVCSATLVGIGVERLGYDVSLTWLAVMGVVTILNYWSMKRWVF